MPINWNVNDTVRELKTPTTIVAVGTLGYFYLKILLGIFTACIFYSILIFCAYIFFTGQQDKYFVNKNEEMNTKRINTKRNGATT